MFAELNFAKTINRFKSKSVKKRRVSKYDETWKRAKNIALQTQSRRENEYDEETLQPERHPSRWELHQEHQRQRMYPLGAGWEVKKRGPGGGHTPFFYRGKPL
jgi:hypothetical protein